ncbi:hypothetical protein AB9P05_23905 [Roseivirga sp. BDSF3-8]|uniref:hypothetical protein n=1 Tax=Roseivirga sp. BDSF3-8 TaxID=3241598 RepID=UPI003531A87E
MNCDCNRTSSATKSGSALNTLSSVALVLFPKCPMCWAAYAGMMGLAGIENLPYTPWLIYVLAALFLTSSAWLTYRYLQRGARLSLGVYLAGIALLACGYFLSFTGQWWLWAGACLMLLPTFLQNLKRPLTGH